MAGDFDLYAVIYDCPPSQARAVLEALADYGLRHDWHSTQVSGDDPHLLLGAAYVDAENHGYTADLAERLIKEAPAVSFKVWTAPCGGELGHSVLYTPELGRFEASCDAGGDAVFDAREVRESAEKGCAAVLDLIGAAWTEKLNHLASLIGQADGRVEVPPAALAGLDEAEQEDLAYGINAILHGGRPVEPWCNHDAPAVRNGRCECGAEVSAIPREPIRRGVE